MASILTKRVRYVVKQNPSTDLWEYYIYVDGQWASGMGNFDTQDLAETAAVKEKSREMNRLYLLMQKAEA